MVANACAGTDHDLRAVCLAADNKQPLPSACDNRIDQAGFPVPASGGSGMSVLQKYFATEIIRSVLFVLAAFLALFAFFDLMGEVKSIGRGGYQLQHAFLYVL